MVTVPDLVAAATPSGSMACGREAEDHTCSTDDSYAAADEEGSWVEASVDEEGVEGDEGVEGEEGAEEANEEADEGLVAR